MNNLQLKDLKEVFRKHLLLKDTMVIEVTLATVFANKLEGDPLWLLIIAPPSSAKTEIITSLSGIPNVFPLSSLTAHTLVSGMISGTKEDKSLILQLNSKILAIKDFTSVISMHREPRAEILSQLREIYDGKYKKHFGTGQVTNWEGKIGIIAGVTPVIDTHYAIFQVLGERFVQYRIESPDPIEMALKGIDNSGKENVMRQELMKAVKNLVETTSLPKDKIALPSIIKNKIAYLSAFCVRTRSGSVRDGRSRELIYTPEPESPPRLAKQFVKLGEGLAIINNRKIITEEDYQIIYRVGFDTIPKQRKEIIFVLNNSPLSANDIAKITRYPYSTTYKLLEELKSLSLVDSLDNKVWSLTDLTSDFLAKIKPVSEMS